MEGSSTSARSEEVPNVPCGVERLHQERTFSENASFLMYRVELKVESLSSSNLPKYPFLMYRVELKARVGKEREGLEVFVPNVPCGVESLKCFIGIIIAPFCS